MQLRYHPLMIHGGVSNWPPKWQAMNGNDYSPVGETGLVRKATVPQFYPDTCVLIMENESRSYMGFMTFDDPAFCRKVCALINSNAGLSITQVGDLEF